MVPALFSSRTGDSREMRKACASLRGWHGSEQETAYFANRHSVNVSCEQPEAWKGGFGYPKRRHGARRPCGSQRPTCHFFTPIHQGQILCLRASLLSIGKSRLRSSPPGLEMTCHVSLRDEAKQGPKTRVALFKVTSLHAGKRYTS